MEESKGHNLVSTSQNSLKSESGHLNIDSNLYVKYQNSSYWLVGCFGFNGPLRQYFSLYRAVSQREGERGE